MRNIDAVHSTYADDKVHEGVKDELLTMGVVVARSVIEALNCGFG